MVREVARKRKDSHEVAQSEHEWDYVVSSWESFEDALNALEPVSIGDLIGDGFVILKNKELLINVPFLLVDWKELTDPKTMRDYATIRLWTSDGRKFRISDGSSGIYRQLLDIRERFGRTKALAIGGGLTKSEYFIDPDSREIIQKPDEFVGPKDKAVTYYLSHKA